MQILSYIAVSFMWIALLLAGVAVVILLADLWGALENIQFNDDFVREMRIFVDEEIEREIEANESHEE
jgi:nitrogen fixation-related uncharacterized protein